ncbi:acyltransferase [Rheinheimera sp. F8]|uniref:acyltransferase family protein n=1 Tax=Rheinheimera sp. F8 TaxID=1763998 RepID=UPI000744822D|nr:acyltransferase [Rheinheimera sp. F8]ALZ75434.1 hypothetical protein ATY27_06480 [Rheinheimera sp. F8]ALZ77536.1 hypothetical protein ATY27_18380 [Rheinheimera sp. F8]
MRNSGLDYLKFGMALMVIGIHCASIGYHSELWGVLTAQGLFRVAVPVFFIINGYYLYDSIRKGQATAIVSQLFMLFTCWQLIYLYFYADQALTQTDQFLTTLLLGYNHLWYLSALVVSVIAVYFIRRGSTRQLSYWAVSLYLFGVLLQYGTNYQWLPMENGYLYFRSALFFGIPFVLIGFLLRREGISRLPGRFPLLWLLGALSLLVIEAALNYQQHQQVVGYDLPLSALLAAPVLFLWALGLPSVSSGRSRLYSQMATTIYLIHPWFNYLLHLLNVPQGSIGKYAGSVLGSMAAAYLYLLFQQLLSKWQRATLSTDRVS